MPWLGREVSLWRFGKSGQAVPDVVLCVCRVVCHMHLHVFCVCKLYVCVSVVCVFVCVVFIVCVCLLRVFCSDFVAVVQDQYSLVEKSINTSNRALIDTLKKTEIPECKYLAF